MQNDTNNPAAITETAAKPVKPRKPVKPVKPAKPARNAADKPAKPAKPAQSDAEREAARVAFSERVAADRREAAKRHNAFDPATVSIPVKSFAAFKRDYRRDVQAHAIGRKPSARQAACLTFACLAGGKAVADGATFPRRFTYNGRELAIENGALSDAIASGLATYNGQADTVTIRNAAQIKSLIGTFDKLA